MCGSITKTAPKGGTNEVEMKKAQEAARDQYKAGWTPVNNDPAPMASPGKPWRKLPLAFRRIRVNSDFIKEGVGYPFYVEEQDGEGNWYKAHRFWEVNLPADVRLVTEVGEVRNTYGNVVAKAVIYIGTYSELEVR